eukprot:225884-Pelagomonas_calceolata.AAC.1
MKLGNSARCWDGVRSLAQPLFKSPATASDARMQTLILQENGEKSVTSIEGKAGTRESNSHSGCKAANS